MGELQLEISRPFRLGGFATGDYMCKCMTCGGDFTGDKRAMTCLPCVADRINAARSEAQPSGYDGLAERDEMLSWLDVSIVRLNGCHDLGEVNLRNKYIRLRALLAAPSTRLHEGQAT